MCRCVSTKPGITIMFAASITCAVAVMFGWTAAIFAALDQHVRGVEVADLGIEREHATAFEQRAPALRRGRCAEAGGGKTDGGGRDETATREVHD